MCSCGKRDRHAAQEASNQGHLQLAGYPLNPNIDVLFLRESLESFLANLDEVQLVVENVDRGVRVEVGMGGHRVVIIGTWDREVGYDIAMEKRHDSADVVGRMMIASATSFVVGYLARASDPS